MSWVCRNREAAGETARAMPPDQSKPSPSRTISSATRQGGHSLRLAGGDNPAPRYRWGASCGLRSPRLGIAETIHPASVIKALRGPTRKRTLRHREKFWIWMFRRTHRRITGSAFRSRRYAIEIMAHPTGFEPVTSAFGGLPDSITIWNHLDFPYRRFVNFDGFPRFLMEPFRRSVNSCAPELPVAHNVSQLATTG